MPDRSTGKLRYSTSMSLDGFVAGRDESPQHPLGVGGRRLHEWMTELAAWRRDAGQEGGVTNASTAVYEEDDDTGAIIMGHNMFGGGPGPWDDDPWKGWWGDDPPFHMPVFVLTHHSRAPLEAARAAAGGAGLAIAGGACVARQYLAAGLVDEVTIHLVAAFLGAGVRLLDEPGLADVGLEQVGVVDAPGVTHLTYLVRTTLR